MSRTRTSTTSTDPVGQYAREVVAGRQLAGPQVRAACARHLRDRKEGRARGLRWDLGAAKRAIGFFADVLRLNGGEHEGKPFTLEAWEQFIVGSLFGWKGGDGHRRFRTAYVEAGKGNGKSPLAAGIGLYMLTADGEARAEVYAAATTRNQAMVLFRDAVAMVDQSPALSRKLVKSGVGVGVWNLAHLARGAFFRPLSSDDGQSGPRPHCGLIDEIHEHKSNIAVEMMRAGVKGRRQALIFMITNSGVDRTSVCYDYHQYGSKVTAGDLEDDSFFAYICALDEGEDPFEDSACWIKANPSLGVTFQPKYLEEQVRQARGMPAKESIVRRLNFCQWVDAANPWIEGDLWRTCQGDFSDAEIEGLPCFLGLDLSSTRDLTALAAVWRRGDQLYARLWFWTPEATLEERARNDNAPYRAWVTKGFLNAVPGRVIDYAYVARQVIEIVAHYQVSTLAFDRHRISDFHRELDEQGLDAYIFNANEPEGYGLRMMRHGQGHAGGGAESELWMPRSVNALEDAVLKSTLRVQPNPVLNWASASAVLHVDPAGNKKWEKRKSTGRIDGIVALSMAVGAAMHVVDEEDDVGIEVW